mgnify:CR=1 FL=1
MNIRQRSRRSLLALVAISGAFAFLYGCTSDSIGTFNAPDEMSEVGTADTGPREDTRFVPDTNIESEAEVVPQSPADNAYCNQDDWCWIHPAPLPHGIRDLQRVDDRVFGVAYAPELKGLQPLIWNDDQMSLLSKPVPPAEELMGMTTSKDGWLALDWEGTVYDVGPEGVRQTRELPSDFVSGISGTDIDNFVAHTSEDVLVMRDGRLNRVDPPQGLSLRSTFMWPNGDMLGITKGGEFGDGTYETRSDGRWRILPFAPQQASEELTAIGPLPTAPCASRGTYLGTKAVDIDGSEGHLYRWDTAYDAFGEVTYDGSGIRSIGCSPTGQLLLTNDDSQILTRTGTATPYWERSSATDEPINETLVMGDDLYASSSQGDHVVLSDSNTRRLGSGFTVPDALDPLKEPLGVYSSFWVSDDGGSMVLSHDRGLFVGDDEGWSRMPSSSEYNFQNVQNARVWGFDRPRFAASSRTLWRWDGELWVNITEQVFDTSSQAIADLLVFGPDDVWMQADGNLYHHDGDDWTNVSAPGSALSKRLEAEDLEMNRLLSAGNGRVLFGAGGSVYHLERDAEDWSFSLIAEPPCDLISEVFQGDDGRLWVVGRDTDCIAGRQGDRWMEYDWPDDKQVPPGSSANDRRTHWVQQPSSAAPLLITDRGILEPQPDGTFRNQFVGRAHDAVHLETPGVTLVVTDKGVVANYE